MAFFISYTTASFNILGCISFSNLLIFTLALLYGFRFFSTHKVDTTGNKVSKVTTFQ
jgi:hypothetical protein